MGCLDLKAELKEDGTRETLDDMHKKRDVKVQLFECHGNHNQHYQIVDGQFKSNSLKDMCLTVQKAEDNADITLEKCDLKNPNQQWVLTGDGYVKIKGSNECMDVEAKLKEDGTREVWHEIKEHKEVNVHLYKCHDPEKTQQDWAVQDMATGASGSSLTAMIAVGAASAVGAVTFFVVGAMAALRFRRPPALAGMEE